ncbi:MAG: HupE/UreJ family protein [Woeseiaceae bacterium]|nr:HupE/UreJ family protein [Woeseiaceae bacterium]
MPASTPSFPRVPGRALILLSLFAAWIACAHPEDEFCVPGEGSLDPALCEQLAALDSADGKQARLVQPILDESGAVRGFWSTFGLYVTIGVGHILPGGLDHILFVLALFLTSTRLRALVIQISTFTVAHTATLGLAAAGVISPSADVVEPLIAATIAFVAFENLFLEDMPRWRPLLVFVFGLLHGLGFAGFFGELGLPPGQFWSALIGFNVGVEIGQLSVVVVAFLLAWQLRRSLHAHDHDAVYRSWLVLPGSALIGVIGFWWAVERTFF